MPNAQQFRDFAQECRRWADKAKDASERDILLELARVWTERAAVVEQGVADKGREILQELRNNLD